MNDGSKLETVSEVVFAGIDQDSSGYQEIKSLLETEGLTVEGSTEELDAREPARRNPVRLTVNKILKEPD